MNDFQQAIFSCLGAPAATVQAPKVYRISREFEFAKRELEGGIFKSLIGDGAKPVSLGIANRNVSLTLIQQVNFALQQTLYNQSYLTGNTKDYTGLSKKNKTYTGAEFPAMEYKGEKYYYGEIVESLSKLASLAFGVDKPTNNQKKQVEEVLKILSTEGVTIKYDNGDKVTRNLIFIHGTLTKDKRKTKYLDIILTPLYSVNMAGSYGLLPYNTMALIGRISSEKLTLVSLLAIQKNTEPFSMREELLIEKLNLTAYWKKNRKLAERKLTTILDDLIKAGQIKGTVENGEVTRRGWKWDNGYIKIELNPNFTKVK